MFQTYSKVLDAYTMPLQLFHTLQHRFFFNFQENYTKHLKTYRHLDLYLYTNESQVPYNLTVLYIYIKLLL